MLEAISENYHTPREILPFLLRLFDYLEVYNHKELAKKNNKDGVFVILDNNLKFEYIITVDKYSFELESKVKNKFKNFKCYFLASSLDDFNAEKLFNYNIFC